ncbi:ABC transporter ATP-binding protein [Streptomyces sp. NPDC052236]|uniref:ABC transporter ATP-binding protein n=1 Tax=Streptomyces sp. NPDC052236 TaxID=3365686 RepID=UPI0037CEB4EA
MTCEFAARIKGVTITEPKNVIDATALWRRYGSETDGYTAVRGIDLTVPAGRVFALLGTNGAGKTSTLELLEGLAAPTRGHVRLFGDQDPFLQRRSTRSRMGIMLQHGGFSRDLSVRETLRMWASCTTAPRPIGEALSMVGLTDRADVIVKHLSGGEKRRLDLALTTLSHPELIFLDEPTTGMDPEGRHDTWKIIKELNEQGATVVVTTHYLEEAEQLADQLAIMHEGQIATTGTVGQIVAAHPSTLSFRLPVGVPVDRLPSIEHLQATAVDDTGSRIHLQTRDLQTTTHLLLDWAGGQRVRLEEFDARSASLEEAFLHIARSSETDPQL